MAAPELPATHVRKTSIAVFNEIKESGLLSEMRQRVYEIVFKHGPMTGSQLIQHFAHKNSGSFVTRLSELREMGLIYEVKEDTCPITGRQVIFWDVTNNLPKKLQRRESPARQLIREIRYTVSPAFLGLELTNKIDRFLKVKK